MTPAPVLGLTFVCIAITVTLALVPLAVSILHSLSMPTTRNVPQAGSDEAIPPPTADLGKDKNSAKGLAQPHRSFAASSSAFASTQRSPAA